MLIYVYTDKGKGKGKAGKSPEIVKTGARIPRNNDPARENHGKRGEAV
jgi:hypothetical protein